MRDLLRSGSLVFSSATTSFIRAESSPHINRLVSSGPDQIPRSSPAEAVFNAFRRVLENE